MYKIMIPIVLFLALSLEARIVDGIALIVEGEPITLAEIRAVRKQVKVSKKEAINLLIQDRLQKSAMKDIVIQDADIDKKIAMIARKNNINTRKMRTILKEQGTSWRKYRNQVKDEMKKEKFYHKNVLGAIETPTQNELQIFYTNNSQLFSIPLYLNLNEYTTVSKDVMDKFIKTKKLEGITKKVIRIKTDTLNPDLLNSILKTRDGRFTSSFNRGDSFVSYKVLSKEGKTGSSFQASKAEVEAKWREEQQNVALRDYFEKLKTNADIQRLR